ncbi:hypothetical protein LXA43DRAFT_1104072 [Ganoderma leucocontextum]|nr:hypothetical protein LXA43DRAFT_1104072 [Ganoderma leucocontextum]
MPPELISLILTKLWEESHSPDERSTLLKNIVLVNHTWLTLIAPIASCDVHIANRQCANVFLGRHLPKLDFPGDRDLFTREASQFANKICRSLTFYGNQNTSPGGPTSKDTPATWSRSQISDAGTVWVVLYIVNAFDQLPNLRRISFRYTDWAYDDISKTCTGLDLEALDGALRPS